MPDSTLIALDYYHELAISKGADRQVYRSAVRKGIFSGYKIELKKREYIMMKL